jgi:D-alanyl-D-alanine carboxypeptidase/D-alanyl-D-alanine-endopeptidase (penicillin-binding protein 4)
LGIAAATELPLSVQQALRSAGIPQSSVGAVVQEVGSDSPTLEFHSREPKNPASVMKLVTTYAALELLGPAFRWKTEAYLDGTVQNDVLEGNLYLKGYGDPKLNYESFWMLLRGLRSRGLRELRGHVVLDRSYFGVVADGRIDNDSFRPYNVAPDALLLNFKSLRFTFLPESERNSVRVFADPALPGMQIANSLKLVAGGACPDGRAFRDLIQATFQSKPPLAAFSGSYPVTCGERTLNVALHAPEDYVSGMIRHLWAEMGGVWTGSVRDGLTPPGARLAYVHESEGLVQVVRDINKFSNNVMARQLYLTLAAEQGGSPANPDNAQRAVREWLARKNIAAPELTIENGSGLSRIERISPASLAALLQAAWRSPLMPEFVSSLPVVAADGTMRKRLRGEGVAGNAHIKTGLLMDARSIAGYVLDRNGRRHAVVMLVNHPNAPQSEAALDAMLRWIYEGNAAAAADSGKPAAAKARAPARSSPRAASPRRP